MLKKSGFLLLLVLCLLAAGTALAMAIASGATVQTMDVAALQSRLKGAGVLLDVNKRDG